MDNEIFFAPVLPVDDPKDLPIQVEEQPSFNFPLSPAQHILETLSKPKYVDASEFRNTDNRRSESLPPFLDINRHLTLIKASHRFAPPVEYVTEESDNEAAKSFIHEFLPPPSALFRGDVAARLAVQSETELAEDSSSTTEASSATEAEISTTSSTTEATTEKEELLKFAFKKREPIVHSLSPLSHILEGFRSEFGPFGGDSSRDRFISAFRPEDF